MAFATNFKLVLFDENTDRNKKRRIFQNPPPPNIYPPYRQQNH